MKGSIKGLAARAVATHKRWQWLPGMKAVGCRDNPEAWFRLQEPRPRLTGDWRGALPDLEDAATLGCVLALYDLSRKTKACPDPVFTAISVYGLADIQAIAALIEGLENAP